MNVERPTLDAVHAVLQRAVQQGHLRDRDALVFHDLDLMACRIRCLRELLPEPANHCVAVKANPVLGVLRHAVEAGAGLECASMEEVHLALAAGCERGKIVCDSPAKTRRDLEELLELGIHVNVDSFDELRRVAEIVGSGPKKGPVGVRINPLVGSGTISMTSVGDQDSKFGIPLHGNEAEIVEAFSTWTWLDGLHVHVGSQGVSMEQLRAGMRAAVQLADLVERELGREQIESIDVGGGLSTTYRSDDEETPSLEIYARAVAEEISRGDRPRRVVTELGRAIQAHCGFAVSRIEYLKELETTRYAVVHLGADFLMRPVYQPDAWHHEVHLAGPEGVPKSGPSSDWSIAGPLCFGGDVIARRRLLPDPEVGDLLVIRDVGAYTIGLWSRHCSRGLPRVLGIRGGRFETLFSGESPADVVRFWGAGAT